MSKFYNVGADAINLSIIRSIHEKLLVLFTGYLPTVQGFLIGFVILAYCLDCILYLI